MKITYQFKKQILLDVLESDLTNRVIVIVVSPLCKYEQSIVIIPVWTHLQGHMTET